MKAILKRALSFLLIIIMCTCLLPGIVIADSVSLDLHTSVWDGKVAKTFAGGRGTASDPYLIETAQQLAYLAKSVNAGTSYSDRYFKLANDIVLNDTSNWEQWGTANEDRSIVSPANKWTPIGTGVYHFFDGTFDGDGHTVSGIYINNTSDSQGLFGYVCYGTIKNVGVERSYVKGNHGIGGVIGYNVLGTVNQCYNRGNISGEYSIGGVVGYLDGTINQCYNGGNISGKDDVGGVVGYLDGTVDQCYNRGNISGKCDVGGVAGYNVYGEVFDCYYLNTCVENSNTYGTALTDVQMKEKSFYAYWDFNKIWELTPDVNDGYPTLRDSADNTAVNWSGTGTEEDPYMIETAEQLEMLTFLVNGGKSIDGNYFKLANDIELNDTSDWKQWGTVNEDGSIVSPANKWTPIGRSDKSFGGAFDGDGHVISGIYINNYSDYQGLFGYVSSGSIKNVGIEKSYIKGYNYAGGVVGYSNYSMIADCYFTGKVSGNDYVGGVVGDNCNGSAVTKCYNTGLVSGNENIGGIAGYSSGSIGAVTKCYNRGRIYGDKYVGGVIGYKDSGTVDQCYSTGEIIGKGDVGGVAGYNVYGEVLDCYYLNTGVEESNTYGDACTDVQMKEKSFYVNWDFNKAWDISPDVNDGYPTPCDNADNTAMMWSGTGTEEDPYMIETAEQLEKFALSVNSGMTYNSKHIKLANDIVLNDTTDWEKWGMANYGGSIVPPSSKWTSIGNSNKSFRGTFNGDGHTVSGIYSGCLFGYVNNGTVKNIGVVKSYIKGSGGIVGHCDNGSTVTDCYFSGIVSGGDYVGGIAGYIEFGSTVTKCYNTGLVNGHWAVGGIVGCCGNDAGYYETDSAVIRCYNIGSVSGENNVGGVVGNLYYGSVDQCYNTGEVIVNKRWDTYRVGGVVGRAFEGNVADCYYLDTSVEDYSYGVRCTDAQMKEKETYQNWDFDSIWDISPDENNGYPTIRGLAVSGNPVCRHDYEVTVTSPTCTENGYTTYSCIYCDDFYVADIVTALDHNYGIPSYAWDGDKCTATRVCAREINHKETETVTASYVKDTDATCTSNETGHREATFTNSAFAKQSTSVNSVEKANSALNHAYGTPIYIWSGDKCTATRICTYDASHIETETAIRYYVKDTSATCTENEKGHYEVTFNNTAFTKQSTAANSVEKPGTAFDHEYGAPTYTWYGDKCTGTRICINDAAHKETETVTVSYVKDTDATCTANEVGHFEAIFTTPAFSKQSTTVNGVEKANSALNHAYGSPIYTWEENQCTATRICGHDTSHIETETVTGIYVKDIAAICTENEKGHYEATFTNPAFAKQTTAANSAEKADTALDHAYGTPSYTWDGDKCTATRVCTRDTDHKETETVTASYVKDTAATCTENEKGHYEVIFTNDAFVKQTTIANSVEKADTKLNHSFTNYVSNNDATCTEDGTKTAKCDRCTATDTVTDVGSKLGHDYGTVTYTWHGDECTAKRICKHDNAHVETETAVGIYIKDTEATCTANETGHYEATFINAAFADQTTAANGVEKSDTALGHNWQWITDKAATKTATGLKHEECSRCHAKRNENTVTDMLICDHSSAEKTTAKSPTCTDNGSKAYWYCPDCNKYFSDEACRVVISENIERWKVMSALGHDFSTEWTQDKAPSCTEAGSQSHHCMRCEAVNDVTEVPALNHSFTNYVSNNDATCTEDGTKTAKCDRCDATDTVTDAGSALGHEYADGKCIRCGADDPDYAPAVVIGDANGDGKVTAKDASALAKYLAGWQTDSDMPAGDTNGDGIVNGKDLALLMKYLAGWDVSFASAKPALKAADAVTLLSREIKKPELYAASAQIIAIIPQKEYLSRHEFA